MRINARIIAYLTLVVHWGPSNALSYGWGFFILFFVLFVKPSWLFSHGVLGKKVVRYVLYFILIFALSTVANALLGNFSMNNLLWNCFTYGSTLCTLVVLFSLPFKEDDAPRIFWFSVYLTLFQVALGYFQMLYAQSFQSLNPFAVLGKAAGDLFVGTTFDVGIGNIVAIKISLTVLMFIPFWFSERNIRNSFILLFLLIGWVLPSAIYTLIIGFTVIVFYYVLGGLIKAFLTLRMPSTIFYALVTAVLLVGIFAYTQWENVEYTIESLRQVYTTAANKDVTKTSGKVVYYREVFSKLPSDYPWFPLVGVGPGNYSSRSAWLVSGAYLEEQPNYISITPSAAAKKYLIPLWGREQISESSRGAGSITNQPFSTWISLFSELGIGAVMVLSLLFLKLDRAFRKTEQDGIDSFQRNLVLGLRMVILYFVILFFVDNLFEWPMVMAQFFVFAALTVRRLDAGAKKFV